MDRQDTQNIFSDGEFENLEQHLSGFYAEIPNNPSIFDGIEAGSNCRPIENNQPLQQNQQYLHQQHQEVNFCVAQPPVSNIKIELQPTIGTSGKLKYVQHSHEIQGNAFLQSRSRYSSTPPELMRGVPLSEVQQNLQPQTGSKHSSSNSHRNTFEQNSSFIHNTFVQDTFASFPLNGSSRYYLPSHSNDIQPQPQVQYAPIQQAQYSPIQQACQGRLGENLQGFVSLGQIEGTSMQAQYYQDNIASPGHIVHSQNHLEIVTVPVPPVINSGYIQHQQQITYCDNQMQDNVALENGNVCQLVTNVKKSPDEMYSVPFSPGTIIATEIIDMDCKNEQKYSAHAGSTANDEAIYHAINKSINENLPHSPSIDFSNLKNWKGDFNYDIIVAAGQLKKNKVCYSKKLDRVYCNPYMDFELHVTVNNWQAMTAHDAEVRVIAVYADPENRTRPVNRCFQCLKNDNVSAEKAKAHLVQLSNPGSRYTNEGSRDAVYLPLVRSHAGADHVTMLVRCTCVTSCVGGPNRRAFCLVFSLMMGGVERGRRVLPLKCCKGALRDMRKDEEGETDMNSIIPSDATNRLSGTVTSSSHVAPSNIFSSPKQLVSSTKTGTSKAVNKRKTSKNMVISTNDYSAILTSSDSDSDLNVTVKKQRATSPLSYAMPTNNTNIPAGYVCAVFPEQFQDDVKNCLERLISLHHVRKNCPNVLQQMKL